MNPSATDSTTPRAEPGTEQAWLETAAQFSRNADYYRGLIEQIGRHFGTAAYTSDDGSVQQDILCAKVPDLVAAALTGPGEAGALYAFMGWLTSRRPVSGPFSAAHDAAAAAQLVDDFCRSQGWGEPRQGWEHTLKPYPDA